MSKALYRKYRSKSLDEIVGQQHVTTILARSLKAGRVAHAYLLTGPRGVGKTSIARILAHEINGLPYEEGSTHLDIIEIDAASNNGVEDVRDLREKIQIAPVHAAKKVYIIDEVHMLSKAAFNALLKTLEEPPEHAVFILATTDADKLPATIISRTQRFSFRTIPTADAVKHLRHIADAEKIKIDDDALELIAQRGDGSFRDSISLLDQLRHGSDEHAGITREFVETSLGLAPLTHVEQLLAAYEARDLKKIVALLDEADQSGIQPTVLATQLVRTVRETVAEKPQLLSLLDSLLDVTRSPLPQIKLLTVLAAHATPKPKSAALVASPQEVSAPIRELEEQAVRTIPHHDRVSRNLPEPNGFAPGSTRAPASGRARAADVLAQEGSEKHSATAPARVTRGGAAPSLSVRNEGADRAAGPAESDLRGTAKGSSDDGSGGKEVSEQEAGKQSSASQAALNPKAFDWQKIIDYARQHSVAVYSVLSKCTPEIQDDKLVLYTGNAFYKKKLDDSKHRLNLAKALEETGVGGVPIETIASPPPPKDSTAAAVAAIMGGGEEVVL